MSRYVSLAQRLARHGPLSDQALTRTVSEPESGRGDPGRLGRTASDHDACRGHGLTAQAAAHPGPGGRQGGIMIIVPLRDIGLRRRGARAPGPSASSRPAGTDRGLRLKPVDSDTVTGSAPTHPSPTRPSGTTETANQLRRRAGGRRATVAAGGECGADSDGGPAVDVTRRRR